MSESGVPRYPSEQQEMLRFASLTWGKMNLRWGPTVHKLVPT